MRWGLAAASAAPAPAAAHAAASRAPFLAHRLPCAMPHLSARFRRSKKEKVPNTTTSSSHADDLPPTTTKATDRPKTAIPSRSDGMLAHLADHDLAQQPHSFTTDHAHELGQAAGLPDDDSPKHDLRQGSPPSLSVTTTTTPPSSSHSDNSNASNYSTLSSKSAPTQRAGLHPLKSPFRGFHLRTNKRSRSPAPPSLHLHASAAVAGGHVSPVMTASSPLSASYPASPTRGESDWPDLSGSLVPKKKLPSFLTSSYQTIEHKFAELQAQERYRCIEGMRDPSPTGRFRSSLPLDSKKLDRYQNIQPWANNRVKLKVPEGCLDYINASPLTLASPLDPEQRGAQNFIAMQGPKRETMEHTWRMVVEQLESPAVIVMLTETHEGIQEKCYPYFPRTVEDEPIEVGEMDEFGDGFRATITCASVEELLDGAIDMRKLAVKVEGEEEERIVWHLLYRRWPDFGVPALDDIGSFLELMRLSREKNVNPNNSRIVHCSAGVGRSGTFITLDSLMREVESGDLEDYDEKHTEDLVYDTVNSLREQRRVMVQSDSQYFFIYHVLRQQWFAKYGLMESTDEPAAKRLELEGAHDPFLEN